MGTDEVRGHTNQVGKLVSEAGMDFINSVLSDSIRWKSQELYLFMLRARIVQSEEEEEEEADLS